MNITRPLVSATALLGLFISGCSQPEDFTAPMLEPQYGTPQQDGATFVVTNESGYLYTLGGVWDYYGDSDEVLLKRFSPAGQELWSYSVDSCSDLCYTDEGGAGIDAAGNAYVLTTYGGADIDALNTLVKLSPAGTVLWSHEVPDSGGMATSTKGETVLASLYHTRLTKYGSNGQQLFDVPLASHVSSLAVASNGSIYAFGSEKLVKYSGTGKVLWQRAVPYGPGLPWDVAVSGNSVYLVASSYTNDVGGIRLYKYSSGGSLLWQRHVTRFGEAYASDISADASGNVYLSGATITDDGYDDDFFVRKYTASGSVAWTYAPDLRSTSERASGVSATDSGKVYVAGSTNAKVNGQNFGGQDAFLLRLDTSGRKVWSR